MDNFLVCLMQYLDILTLKKVFAIYQESKCNWASYVLSGNAFAESLDLKKKIA